MDTCSVAKRLRVMILDHDWNDGIGLADRLAGEGYQPVLVRSLEAALSELCAARPDAVVLCLAWLSPDAQSHGMEIIYRIKTACPDVPVFTVTDPGHHSRSSGAAVRAAASRRPRGFRPLLEALPEDLRTGRQENPAFRPLTRRRGRRKHEPPGRRGTDGRWYGRRVNTSGREGTGLMWCC
jgi:DNA-binding NtrC family response regulator